MRSTMSKALLAAALISTPLTEAFAAGPATTYVSNGQLDSILTDLRDANAHIASDRSQGLMTPAEARSLHLEVASISKSAIAANKDGAIPMGQYRPLMAQVENLQGKLFEASYDRWGIAQSVRIDDLPAIMRNIEALNRDLAGLSVDLHLGDGTDT